MANQENPNEICVDDVLRAQRELKKLKEQVDLKKNEDDWKYPRFALVYRIPCLKNISILYKKDLAIAHRLKCVRGMAIYLNFCDKEIHIALKEKVQEDIYFKKQNRKGSIVATILTGVTSFALANIQIYPFNELPNLINNSPSESIEEIIVKSRKIEEVIGRAGNIKEIRDENKKIIEIAISLSKIRENIVIVRVWIVVLCIIGIFAALLAYFTLDNESHIIKMEQELRILEDSIKLSEKYK